VSPARAEQVVADHADAAPALRTAAPGRLWPWVKRASWVELGVFALLLVFWLAPGAESETFIFGLSHGIGYIVLCVLIWAAILRHEAPYTLLAATLTPVGPLGSVIGIEVIERKRRDEPGVAEGAGPDQPG
jgi:hypothetical protein